MSTSTQRVRALRQKRRALGIPIDNRKQTKRDKVSDRKFIGCDGEGCGVDHLGRQLFMLFRIGENELYTGKHLTTAECLDHICHAPGSDIAILVGFSFGYDVTMILRDLDNQQRARLFAPKERGKGKSPYIWFENFGIDYLPRQYLRVCRIKHHKNAIQGNVVTKIVPGTTRTIWETFGFFQKSFLAALRSFNIGEKHWQMLDRNKSNRSDFLKITDEIRHYNKIECDLLGEMMETLRENCNAANIIPRTWSGAGKLAEALHHRERTLSRDDIEARVPREVLDLAEEAYYGGRFEISRTGKVAGPLYEYDIRSAYPAAMVGLPCLEHGKWEPFDRDAEIGEHELFVASCNFRYTKPVVAGTLGGLPIRSKKGHIFWPMEGNGVYWSDEIRSAQKIGFDINIRKGWRYVICCECKTNHWVDSLYEYRKSIGSGGKGYPIKLAINSLYGKLAQRIGRAYYHNLIWAGIITARTRALLNNAIAQNQGRIIMLATDAVYSLDKLNLPTGDKLGEWELSELQDGLFIVQPGLYWGAKKKKTRGMPLRYFEQPGKVEQFFQVWENWLQEANAAYSSRFLELPSVTVEIPCFTALKIAQARGKPETAGVWGNQRREISFDWTNKRAGHVCDDGHVITLPHQGSSKLVSCAHKELILSGRAIELDAMRAELEDQPDYVDLGIPWKD